MSKTTGTLRTFHPRRDRYDRSTKKTARGMKRGSRRDIRQQLRSAVIGKIVDPFAPREHHLLSRALLPNRSTQAA